VTKLKNVDRKYEFFVFLTKNGRFFELHTVAQNGRQKKISIR